jgi:uncharacterized membrane protein YphA (DoxX/SURF4 family)
MGTGERNIRQRTRTAATAAARIVVFAVLGYAGLMKLNQPQPTAEFLDSLIQVHSVGLVRTIGVGELALALLVISGAASLWAGRAAVALFTAFAVTHAMAAAQPEPPPPCGCLGTAALATTIPAWAWIAGNTTLALMGGLIAGSSGPRPAPESRPPIPEITATESAHA